MKKKKCGRDLEDREISAVSGGQAVVEEYRSLGDEGDVVHTSKPVNAPAPVQEERVEMP